MGSGSVGLLGRTGIAAMLLAVGGGSLWGQTVTTIPHQGLAFGAIPLGGEVVISPTNHEGRAEIELVGSGRVTVVLDLPDALRSSSGAQVPVTFSPTDGHLLVGNNPNPTVFDPWTSVEVNIPPGHSRALIRLGGRAAAGTTQAAGEYSADIRITVSDPGT